jgi:hypothetical protein
MRDLMLSLVLLACAGCTQDMPPPDLSKLHAAFANAESITLHSPSVEPRLLSEDEMALLRHAFDPKNLHSSIANNRRRAVVLLVAAERNGTRVTVTRFKDGPFEHNNQYFSLVKDPFYRFLRPEDRPEN